MDVTLSINGERHDLEANRWESLLAELSKNGYSGAKRGCDIGNCGFCTAIVDDEPAISCISRRESGWSGVKTIEELGM